MSDFAISNEVVWPTDNDIGVSDGDGDGLFEIPMTKWLAKVSEQNFVVSGGTVPASSGTLNISLAAFDAVIDGKYVSAPSATTITATNTATNYVYAKLSKTALKVTAVSIEVNTTGTPPADSIKLCELVAAGGVISATVDCRPLVPYMTARGRSTVVTATGAGTFVARTDHVVVEMQGAGGGGGDDSAGNGGGGGGSGVYAKMEFATVPGTIYAYNVGLGGAVGTSGGAGADGTATWFNTSAAGNSASFGSGGEAGSGAGGGGGGGSGSSTSSKLAINGTQGGSRSGGTGGTGAAAPGYYQPTAAYGAGGNGASSGGAPTAGKNGFLIIHD